MVKMQNPRTDRRRHRLGATAILGTIVTLLLVGLSASRASAQSLVANRITVPIRSDQMQVMRGTVQPLVARAKAQGQLSGATPIEGMSLVFRLSAAQQADLKNLLVEQQTKGSPMYHQWLQPGQFAARYGVSQQDLAKVAAWLQSRGFVVTSIPASRDRINFSGTAAQVNAAFQTQLDRYVEQGRQGWANATDISLPQAIAGMAVGVEHLNTFRPLPHIVRMPVQEMPRSGTNALAPHYTLSNGSGVEVNYIAPSDAQTIYDLTGLYNNGITGTGQTLGVVGQTDIVQYEANIANFRSLSGLSSGNLPTQVLVPSSGTAQVYVGDLEEADIDTEWAGAIAKDASIVYVTVGNNSNYSVFDSLQYAVQTPLASGNTKFLPVISISYGACEAAFAGSGYVQIMEQALEQANAQGQTVVAASGDSGSADCDNGTNGSGQVVGAYQGLAVDYPGSSQYVTAAGGTSFSGDVTDQSKYWNTANDTNNGSAISYIPETTWNETPTLADLQDTNLGNNQLSASGGGASTLFTKPSWQVGTGVPSDGKRDVPDVSLASNPSHDGYVLCTQETDSTNTAFTSQSSCAYPLTSGEVPYFDTSGSGYVYGGTSIVAPQWAAMITLWNQEAGDTSGVGNANPILYQSAETTPGAFHDIRTGSNAVVCQQGSPDCISDGAGGYVMSCCNAGMAYDEATGLGSVDATALGVIWPRLTQVNGSFSLLLKPAAVTVNPGSSATTQVVLSPSGAGGASTGFSGTVNLACSNMPTGVTCSFAPSASVSLSPGAAQTVTLTITATSSAAAMSVARRSSPTPLPFHPSSPAEMAFVGVLGVFLFGAGRKRRFFPPRWMALLLIVGGLIAAAGLTACGGGSSSGGGGGGTHATKTITVTGTSGTTVASASVALTVT